MIEIISRLRPITLDCYTTNSGVYHAFPVAKSTELYPDWWKSLKTTAEVPEKRNPIKRPMNTVKVCEGLLDLYKSMITIPLWSDIKIQYDNKGNFAWISSADDVKIGHHPAEQFNHEEFSNLIHMKIMVPWIMQEKTGVNFQLFSSDWNKPSSMFDYRIPGGVLNYKYQVGANCNIWLPKKEKATIDLIAGDPLLNLLPLTDRKVIIKNHLIDHAEFMKIEHKFSYQSKFASRYRFLKKLYTK